MLKHIPIFWKLSAAFLIVILIVLLVDVSLESVNALKSNGDLRTILTIVIAIILSCGIAWFIVHFSIKQSVRKLANGMKALAERKFDFHLDVDKKDEFSSLASSFNDVADMISSFQNELNKNLDYLEGIVESTSDIIITVNLEGKILTFNSGAEKALNYKRMEVIGKSIEMLWANPRERDAAIDRLKYGDNVVNIETRFLTKRGEVRDVLLTLSLLRNPAGKMIGTFGISKDITEVKLLQNKLIQSQRYIAIGEVFTGIQHSLKNMLNACKGGAYMVRIGLAKDERKMFEEGWEIVQEGIDRMTKMSSDMLKFVKGWVPKLEEVNLENALSEIDHSIKKSAADKGIEFQMNISSELLHVKCDAQMIHTAVMDIVSNALDACQWKEYDEGEVPKVTVKAYRNNDGMNTVIEIKDNGCGMTEDVKTKIFTPFFSTKSKTGTGLGLSIASRMINAHHGKIDIESESEIGTAFKIILPINANNKSKEISNGKKSSGS
jgi:PAS domain S-box-containing protein